MCLGHISSSAISRYRSVRRTSRERRLSETGTKDQSSNRTIHVSTGIYPDFIIRRKTDTHINWCMNNAKTYLSPNTPETNTFHPPNHCYLDYIMKRFVRTRSLLQFFSSFRIRRCCRMVWKSNLEVHTCRHLYFLSCPYWQLWYVANLGPRGNRLLIIDLWRGETGARGWCLYSTGTVGIARRYPWIILGKFAALALSPSFLSRNVECH